MRTMTVIETGTVVVNVMIIARDDIDNRYTSLSLTNKMGYSEIADLLISKGAKSNAGE
jgi:hypothetical protein